MTENGCGITALSIIASGYGKDYTPNDFREKYYPHLDTTKIQTELKSMGIKCTDFYFDKSYISKTYIENWLKTNRPVLICVDGTKENIWTQSSHYMVLLDCDEKNQVYLSNPNGEDGTEKSSGWYDLNEILPYVVKALFIESY
jgi:ABC-type bacteriocin/lantibiotic exporter with double-glycine peptidase domain